MKKGHLMRGHQTANESNYQAMFFRHNYTAGKAKMQDKYIPFERPERPIEPPEEPTIPEGISGYYDYRNDEFVADEDALETALQDWDLMPKDRQREFKDTLMELFYKDWRRVEAD